MPSAKIGAFRARTHSRCSPSRGSLVVVPSRHSRPCGASVVTARDAVANRTEIPMKLTDTQLVLCPRPRSARIVPLNVRENFVYGTNTSDILFRNDATGDTGYYWMSGGALQGWVDIVGSSDVSTAYGGGRYRRFRRRP